MKTLLKIIGTVIGSIALLVFVFALLIGAVLQESYSSYPLTAEELANE